MLNDQTGVLIVCVVLGCLSDCGGSVRISECSQAGWMEIEDDGQSAHITCVDIPANETVRWEVFTGTASQGVASCGPLRNCTHRGADLAVSRPSDTSSVLTIGDNLRTKVGNGSVSCTAVNLQPNEYFSCKINVITPAPPLSPCNLEVNVTDWTVAGTCRFEHAFSSNGTYTCTWRQHHNQSLPDKTMAGVVEKTEQRLSNKTYYSGTCSFTSLLATRVSEGEYSYSVQFYPGSGTTTVGTLRVDRPGEPRTNCWQYVYEGQDVLCHCLPNASTPGSPPPALQWQGHSAGSPLDLRDVRRDRSGHVFVCTLLWGPPSDRVTKHVNYTLHVAYGPDDVTVTRRQDGQTVESQFLTLVCTVTGVYPSAVVTWTGAKCSSAPNSTGETDDNVCRFRPAQEDDGKVVTCVASNSVFPDHLVRNATYQIEFRGPAKPGASKGNIGGDDQALGPIVGGTVAAVAVVVVAVLVVVIVVIVKRQRRKKPAYTRQLENRTENVSDVEEHVNPIYDSGDVDAAPKPRPKPAGIALRIPSNANSTGPETATASEETATASEETVTASEETVTATGNGTSPTEENTTRTEQNAAAAEERNTATEGNPTESNDRAIENNATEPNATQPNATEPNATQPNATQPNATGIEDNATEPNNTAAEEIKEQDDMLEDELDMRYSTVSFGRKQTATSGDGKDASTSSRPSQGVSLVPASSDPPSGPPVPPDLPSGPPDPPDPAEIGLYESVDMEPPSSSRSPHVRSAGPSANTLLGDVNNQASCLPEGDVYAVVNKSSSRTYPGPSSISTTDPESGWEDEDHTYAVVDKKSSRSNAGAASVASPEPSPGEDHTSQSESSADIYAQVDNSTKRGNSSPSGEPAEEPEVELYAQVQKPKPAVKPKPTVKPTPPQKPILPEGVDREETGTVEAQWTSSDYDDIAASKQEEMVQNTTGDDVYNKLSYSKQTSLPEPTDPDPQYSHIGHV